MSPNWGTSRYTPCEWLLPGHSPLPAAGSPARMSAGKTCLARGPLERVPPSCICIEEVIERVFPVMPFIDVPEDVASMSVPDCELISEGLGRHPVLICAGDISRARRPRLYSPGRISPFVRAQALTSAMASCMT